MGTESTPISASVQASSAPASESAAASTDSGAASEAPASGDNWAYVASGTWCLTGIESKKALATPLAASLNFTNEGGVARTWRVLKNLTGFWILRGLKADVASDISYDEMMAEAKNAEKFLSLYNPNHSLFFNPDSMKASVDEFMRMEESVRESQDLKELVVLSFQYLGEYQGGEDE